MLAVALARSFSLRLCVSAVSLLLATAAGCDRGTSVSKSAEQRRAANEMYVAAQDDAKTLDPHRAADAGSMHFIENLYGTLLRYAPRYGEVEPDLAERYEPSADGLTYTFHLRPNATFHTGRAVTAADVKYSVERIVAMQVRAAMFAAIDEIETPDERTIVFRLKEPFAPLVTYLAHPMNAVVDRAVVEANGGQLDRVDAGSGPFKLVEWRKDQHLVLARHDQHHVPGLPKLGRLVYLPMSDPTARTTALRNGEIDVALDATPKDERVLRGAAGVRVDAAPGTFWEYVGLNTRSKPLDDVRVRRAIAWAVDRDAINRVVKLGGATVLDGGHIPPGHWAHAGDVALYPRRDLEKAKQLLRDAGVGDGLRLVCKVGSAFPYQVAAGQMVKQQLRDVGVDVQLLAQESGVFFEALGKGDFDLTVCGWVGFVDPDEWTYDLFHSKGKWNQQGYANAQVDALLDRGRRAADREQRKQIYADVQRVIADEAPMVFLYANPQAAGLRAGVGGFVVHPTAATIFLREAQFAHPATSAAGRSLVGQTFLSVTGVRGDASAPRARPSASPDRRQVGPRPDRYPAPLPEYGEREDGVRSPDVASLIGGAQ